MLVEGFVSGARDKAFAPRSLFGEQTAVINGDVGLIAVARETKCNIVGDMHKHADFPENEAYSLGNVTQQSTARHAESRQQCPLVISRSILLKSTDRC